MSQFERSAGILLHIVSLPNEFGIGDLGEGACRFIDFLARSGQRIWQLLPLGPTTQGESPYSCYSAFAGNPLLISPQGLLQQGLVRESDVAQGRFSETQDAAINYGAVREFKTRLLQRALDNFLNRAGCEQFDGFEAFCTEHKSWLDDFSLFSALMKHSGTDDWCCWEPGLVARDPRVLGAWREKLSREVEFEQFVQYIFYTQWNALRAYARRQGVKLFGDMPIFVAHGSADVWANQRLFWLDDAGRPTVVAGVPPDYFSRTGQLWGNPLYNWQRLAETDYGWWVQRFRAAFTWYDMLRIDHFRGFEAYWAVPAGAKTAITGKWEPGPGAAPFCAARRALGELPIVAEDLGMITEEVHALRDELGFPGMRVLQFGFDDTDDDFHRPEAYPENSAAYTGTHDNSTIMGWYLGRQQNKQELDLIDDYLQDPEKCGLPIHWQLISMVLHSASQTAIYPMQDVLGLDDSARMNMPGEAFGNWRWRLSASALNEDLADRLKILAIATDRYGDD